MQNYNCSYITISLVPNRLNLFPQEEVAETLFSQTLMRFMLSEPAYLIKLYMEILYPKRSLYDGLSVGVPIHPFLLFRT